MEVELGYQERIRTSSMTSKEYHSIVCRERNGKFDGGFRGTTMAPIYLAFDASASQRVLDHFVLRRNFQDQRSSLGLTVEGLLDMSSALCEFAQEVPTCMGAVPIDADKYEQHRLHNPQRIL